MVRTTIHYKNICHVKIKKYLDILYNKSFCPKILLPFCAILK